ncbi:MAG: hypothetical protein IJG60_08595 [Thermoguttaceae bacterium]|nr:hypothetical protein [Thermoguttaceae bacterium]
MEWERWEFLKVDEAGNPDALTTPIITMKRDDDTALAVDLVAAVHFADAGYYQELNRRFARYDAVLVEMLAPKGTTLAQIAASAKQKPAKFSRIGFLETLQRSMGRALGLVNQLDAIDYSAPNMVLADIDAETLFARISENGEAGKFVRETFFGLKDSEKSGAEPDETDSSEGKGDPAAPEPGLLDFLLARDKQRLARRVFAVELARSLREGNTPFEQSLIRERNTVLLDELKRQIEKGKKTIAVFYGSAHIPDIREHLEEAGFRAVNVECLTAWKL